MNSNFNGEKGAADSGSFFLNQKNSGIIVRTHHKLNFT